MPDGYQLDSDGNGVMDSLDHAPGTPAPAVAPLPLVWAWWETPQSVPVPVEADGVFAEPTEAALSAMFGAPPPGSEPFPYDSLLADNGRFVGRHMDDPLDPPENWRMVRSEWRRQGAGFTKTALPEAGGMFSPCWRRIPGRPPAWTPSP